MKKLKIAVLLLTIVTFITACSCSKKEFLVEFDSNGGTKVQSQTIEKGGKATKPDDPIKEGYTFESWQLDGEKYDFDLEVTENIVLVAKWKKADKKDESVAKVCTLTCEAGQALNTDSCTCYKLTVTSINVKAKTVYLEIGETYEIGATVSPEGVLNKELTYASDKESVSTVTDKGVVTAKAPGKALITITSKDSGKIEVVTIIVLDDYRYSVEKADDLDISYKVTLYKNGKQITDEEAKEIYAVYNAAGKYLGKYVADLGAIIVDKDQTNSIAKIKVNDITYNVRKMIVG